MLEVVYGQTRKHLIASRVVDVLNQADSTGTLYIGYPVLATADDRIDVDALLVSQDHGLIAFMFAGSTPANEDFDGWRQLQLEQDRLFFAIQNNLSRHESLRSGRELAVKVQTVTIFPGQPTPPNGVPGVYLSTEAMPAWIGTLPPLRNELLRPLQAALQRLTTIKPIKKRTNVTRAESRGSILKKIEREIANLDQWQKRAAIESPDGPQRIRGLAGSGKTVVLALKAAYLHAQHPDWRIAVTFHTRALYQQITDFIRRFSFEHLNDEPNWENLRVLHAWGGGDRSGVYTEIAALCEVEPRDFLYAKTRFGRSDAFSGACGELLAITSNREVRPLYDAVLIDEAQDLPPSFFQLVHRFAQPPKRIVWAYDELQKLSEAVMPSTEELFGTDGRGQPYVRLANPIGQPRQDIVLPVCYRNTPWALTLAHALGFGIYRKDGLVQHFDEASLWTEVGYRLVEGQLSLGEQVQLERDPGSYPSYFTDLMHPEDAVVSMTFKSEVEQAEWVAQSIEKNLKEDELEIDDILIVLPDAYRARKNAGVLIEALSRRGISSHLAGVTTSRDQIFSRQSIAIANIHRSKGNEAPMVYVVNSNYCFAGYELSTLRNIIFTGITRSRAWVRVCGCGAEMEQLEGEIRKLRENNFKLAFKVPTAQDLGKLRMIHRERTADEKARIKKAEQGLKDFLETWQRGDLAVQNLPPELRTSLSRLLSEEGAEDEDSE